MKILYEYAMKFVGIPYRWGGDDPILGFDCSGFVQELLSSVGMDVPGDQTAQMLHDHFIKYGIPSVKGLGALCFYGTSKDRITHVTMMLDENLTIGANSGGQTTVELKAAAMANAFVKIRPFNYRNDLVAIVMPNYKYR